MDARNLKNSLIESLKIEQELYELIKELIEKFYGENYKSMMNLIDSEINAMDAFGMMSCLSELELQAGITQKIVE